MTEAFLTGSRVYGKPRFDSDVDLVVLLDKNLVCELQELADPMDPSHDPQYQKEMLSLPLRFGNLNLICCIGEDVFNIWQEGTTQLISEKPVTREHACAVFKQLRIEAFGK